MKIALIGAKGIPSRISGLEIHAGIIAEGLAEHHKIYALCRKRYCSKLESNYNGIEIRYIPSVNTKHLDAVTYSFLATLYAVFIGCDVFWFHALGPACMAWIPGLLGKKVISTVHGLDWKREKFGRLAEAVLKFGERSIAKCADEIIVLNEFDAAHFYGKWKRVCNIIPNGVECKTPKNARVIKEKYGLDRKGYFLFMSRLVPEKNAHDLIAAYMKLKSDKKLVIAGKGVHTGGYERELKRMAALDKNIIFTGFVEGEILEELYSNAYAYVLPSTIEGQSLGLLEAMSYGIPCIVSNIPENVSVIGDAGISFVNGNRADLERQLRYVSEHPDIMEELGQRAKLRVKGRHDWSEIIQRTEEVFHLAETGKSGVHG